MLYRILHYVEMKRLLQRGLSIGKGVIVFNTEDDFGGNPGQVSIGDKCVIAAGVKFITNPGISKFLNNRSEELPCEAKIIIHDNCFIGMNAMIYSGVEIGPNAVVGAGAVVVNNVEPDRCVVGNPAQVTCTLQFYERICKKNETIKYDHESKQKVLQQYFWASGGVELFCSKGSASY